MSRRSAFQAADPQHFRSGERALRRWNAAPCLRRRARHEVASPRRHFRIWGALLVTMLLAFSGVAGGPGGPSPVAAASDPTVTITNNAYSPFSLTVNLGATVTWVNNDPIPHTVAPDTPGAFTASGQIAPGKTYSVLFNTPGTYGYHDADNPSMQGTIVVTNERATPTPVSTPTPTPTPSPTPKPTPKSTPTPTPSPTPTPTPRPTPRPSPTPSPAPPSSAGPSAIPFPGASAAPSSNGSAPPSGLPGVSLAPSALPSTAPGLSPPIGGTTELPGLNPLFGVLGILVLIAAVITYLATRQR